MKTFLNDKTILVTGGTGSLGKKLTQRLLTGRYGKPKRIIIFSRDEAKQYAMKLFYRELNVATEEVMYAVPQDVLSFRIGDVRDLNSVVAAMKGVDIVFNAAALKQVPACEYFPSQAVETNIRGVENIVCAIQNYRQNVETVVGISTDKACKPVNVMGMSKAIQERIIINANLQCPNTRFLCVRYGNVLASRGSVIPLFLEQIKANGPVSLTLPEMTRFLLSLDQAVDTILDAYQYALPGETYVPRVRSSLVLNIAKAMIADRDIDISVKGIRPGEKIHEVLVSEEEAHRCYQNDNYYVIRPLLPELNAPMEGPTSLDTEYSSANDLMDIEQTVRVLTENKLMPETARYNAELEALLS